MTASIQVDRRRAGPPGRPPGDPLMQMPASVLLERLPQPVLAVAHDGTILFANAAFCDMLGYPKEAVPSLNIDQIVSKVDGHSAVVPLQRPAHELVKLLCRDDFVVPATMTAETLAPPTTESRPWPSMNKRPSGCGTPAEGCATEQEPGGHHTIRCDRALW